MVIDGNDERGIDVGLMAREGCAISMMRSHVDDRSADGREIFSRDCPEYHLDMPDGERLVVLVNHFKSKGFGKPAESNARRAAQAARVAEIYDQLRGEGIDAIVVVGDLNDTPDSDPLRRLLRETDLVDIAALDGFEDDGWPGTYGTGAKGNKIDYILLSPALRRRATGAGVFRKGMWTASGRWEMYEELTKPVHAASDHAALWVDFDL
jgi:endonuclease/exonuclease/phosphatase family metal-dependent hydrolase